MGAADIDRNTGLAVGAGFDYEISRRTSTSNVDVKKVQIKTTVSAGGSTSATSRSTRCSSAWASASASDVQLGRAVQTSGFCQLTPSSVSMASSTKS